MKNLYIGIGGTGQRVLINLKKEFVNNFGEIPENHELLVIDTDPYFIEPTFEEKKFLLYSSLKKTQQQENVKKHLLSGGYKPSWSNEKKLFLPLNNIWKTKNQKNVKDWISEDVFNRITPSFPNRSVPQIKRLALYDDENISKLNFVLDEKIKSINNDNQGEVCIHLIFSLGGSTGAGIYIDLAMLLRHKLPNSIITSWNILPGAFMGFPNTDYNLPNAYASLMEMDHLMGAGYDRKEWTNYDPKQPYTVQLPTGNDKEDEFHPLIYQGELFDRIYLFDNKNDKGHYLDLDAIYENISLNLFYHSNIEFIGAFLRGTSKDVYKDVYPLSGTKGRHYCGTSAVELIFERQMIKDLLIKKNSLMILNYLMYNQEASFGLAPFSSNITAKSYWNGFTYKDYYFDYSKETRCWTEHSQRITKDLKGADLLPEKIEGSVFVLLMEKSFTIENSLVNSIENIENIKYGYIGKSARKADKSQNTIFELAEKELNEKLDTLSQQLSKSSGNIPVFLKFLNELKTHLQDLIKIYEEHKIELKLHQVELYTQRNEIKEELTQLEKKWFQKKKIKEKSLKLAELQVDIICQSVDKVRINHVLRFLNKAITIVTSRITDRQTIDKLFQKHMSNLSSEIQNLESKLNNHSYYQISLHNYNDFLYSYVDKKCSNELTQGECQDVLILINKDQFQSFEKEQKNHWFGSKKNFHFFEFLDIENELAERLTKASKRDQKISQIDKIKIEDLFLQNADLAKHMVGLTSIAFKYQVCKEEYIYNPDMQEIKYFLIPNGRDNNACDQIIDEIKKVLYKIDYVTKSPNPDKIILMTTWIGSSARSISGVDQMRKAFYSAMQNNSGYYFNDTYFENVFDLIDQHDIRTHWRWFPSMPDGELYVSFTIAAALDLVRRDGECYKFFDPKGDKPIQIVPGSRGKNDRSLALKHYSENEKWPMIVNDAWDKICEEEEKPKIERILKNHYDRLLTFDYLGKKMESFEPDSHEEKQIWNERKTIKDIAMEFPIMGAAEW